MADSSVAGRVGATARTVPWGLLSVVLLGVALAVLVATDRPAVDRATEIGSLIRCPVCQGVPIADSPSPMARDMMAVLREELAAGATRQEAIEAVLGAYPGSLLLEPALSASTLALWLVPALALLGGAGLTLTVQRARRRPDAAPEHRELDQRLQAVQADLDDLAVQEAAGEVEPETASHLRAAYRAELAETQAALAETALQPESALVRSRTRVVAGAVMVLGGLAVTVAAAGAFLVERPAPASGVAASLENDPSQYSNETLAAVIAANADHPQIDGMRLALAERYFDEGRYSEAFPYFLDVASSKRAQPAQAATALVRLGWMAYDGNGEVEAALGLMDEARRLMPDDPYPLYLEGVITWCGNDNAPAAAQTFRQVLDMGVEDPAVRNRVEEDLAASEAGETCRR